MRLFSAAIAATLLFGSAASAAVVTFDEATKAAGGDFSDVLTAGTSVGAGFNAVSGERNGWERFDVFTLTALSAGKQSFDITFAPVAPIGATDYSYSSGGAAFYKVGTFNYESDGLGIGAFNLSYHGDRSKTLSFDLDDSFAGSTESNPLSIAVIYYNGSNLGFNMSAPSNAAASTTVPGGTSEFAAPVPLPAGVLMLGGALAGLAGATRLRRRKA